MLFFRKQVTGLILFAAGLVLWGAGSAAGQESAEGRALPLSLDECIVKTIKNNLGLQAELLTPQIMDDAVALAWEKFYPALSFAYNKQHTETASYSFLDASDFVATDQNDNTVQVSQFLPTGGTFSGSLYNYLTDTNRSFQTINPRVGTTLRFNFSQPLLRDFGFKFSRREIIVARYDQDISEENLNALVEDTIYQAESAYWNLVYSIENLEVRRQSLKLAQELYEKNKAEIETGTLPPIELLTAEAEVSLRQADILEARALVRNNEELVKTVMNLGAEVDDVKAVRIVPSDSPRAERSPIDFDEALATAIQRRPDLKALRVDIDSRAFDVSYAKNQLLPDVRVNLSYWSPGISGTRILYQDDDALSGIVIGTIPGSRLDAMRDAFGFNYKNLSVGVSVTLPVGNVFSRAAYDQARDRLRQARMRVQDQEQQLTLELGNTVRAVDTNYERAQAYKSARELAQRKLEAEVEKFQVGLSTNYLVLQFQRDLATAQTLELKALIDYKISQAALDRTMGAGRERRGVRFIGESETTK
jgi:outer membrane protein TolC